MNHKLDTDTQVFFYEQEFYVLSNFSAFKVVWCNIDFDTAEHAYHWAKFRHTALDIAYKILKARSAHEAFQIAQENKDKRDPNWDENKIFIMRDILTCKLQQHEYVRRKLLETGQRDLIEDSWRDDYWGWGPDKNGQNKLGKIWMHLRDLLRADSTEIKYVDKLPIDPNLSLPKPKFITNPMQL